MSSSNCCPPGFDKFSADLIYEILLRLPVKSLLRFKAVSKPWHCLISSPGFVNSHQTRPRSCAETNLIIHATSLSLHHFGPSQLVSDLQFPFFNQREVVHTTLVGSDRGIVCIATCKIGWIYVLCARSPTSIYLWNPATKHYKVIPPHTTCDDYCLYPHLNLGFGFDSIDNDFKVVKVGRSPFMSEVYSTNLNAWRNIGRKPMDIEPKYATVCINGLMCWTGRDGILALDLQKEVFTCVTKFPSDSTCACTVDFNNSIAVIMNKWSNGNINLWTLDNDVECLRDGGVVEASWTLMLSIDIDMPVHSVHSYFNSGDMLLTSNDDKCFSYNTIKKEAKEVPFSIKLGQVFKYKETLISLTGFEQVKWNA